MGSGNRRRKADIANPGSIIRANGSNGNGEGQEALNETCPVSKRIKLNNNKFENGQVLYLRLSRDIVSIYAGSTKVQNVLGKTGEKLKHCILNGFEYRGRVNNGYGEFQRTA